MDLFCSNCNTPIASTHVNVSTDIAQCSACNSFFKLSELLSSSINIDIHPPQGSKIAIKKDFSGGIEWGYPKVGFTIATAAKLLFMFVWLSFVTLWTVFASKGSFLFALFSIPFFLIGLTVVVMTLNNIYEVQTLKVDKTKLSLLKKGLFFTKSFETTLKNIQSVKLTVNRGNPFNRKGKITSRARIAVFESPAIITGKKTVHFFENANDAEQEWIISLLNQLTK